MVVELILVVVTGGFGSGKTTVTGAFEKLGCVVFDSDRIVSGLYEKKNVQKILAKEFGAEVIARGKVNRRALAEKAFSDKLALGKLNRLVHPLVFSEIRKKVKTFSRKKIVVVEVPLFFESPVANSLHPDFVVVAWCEKKKAIARLKRKGFSGNEILARMKAQLPLSEKKRLADFVVDNSKSAEFARMQVKKFFDRIITHGQA